MHVESLETRRLLAAAASYVLTINGTSGNDTILLTQAGSVITINKNGVITTQPTWWMTPGETPTSTRAPHVLSKISINGLAGNDRIEANNTVLRRLEIKGGQGNDTLRGGAYNDNIHGGCNLNGVTEIGMDSIYGGDGADELYANRSYSCQVFGENGNDTINGSTQGDTLDGGPDNDSIIGNVGGDLIRGGANNDTIDGGHSNDTCWGGAGNDSIDGGFGNDYLHGEIGNDTITGGDGINTYWGGVGNDPLVGGQNDEVFWGDSGNDTIKGYTGLDRMNGGDDDDLLNPGAGVGDQVQGGAGIDTADYSIYSAKLNISLDGLSNDGAAGEFDNIHYDVENILAGKNDDVISGSSFANYIEGGYGDDLIKAGQGNDTVLGGSGEDSLHGQYGDDKLFGEGSNDKLYGGEGNDTLDGGWGDDTLVSIGGGENDQVTGGIGDRDSFWMDKAATENHDASQTEIDNRCLHRISAFEDGQSKELLGQSLADPALNEPDDEYYLSGQNFDANPLFPDLGPELNDVNQGGLGDCYFLATLGSVVAVDDNLIRQSVTELGDGTYAVLYYEDGEKRYYRVDNDLPANKSNNGIAYAGLGAQNSMWVAIMEKAYAKHAGDNDYWDIDGGWAEDAFDNLGIANEEIDVDDDNVMQTIKGHLDAGRPVTITTEWGSFDVGDNYVASHVYSVVAIFDDGSILLRNPWGTDAGGQAGAWVQGANDGYVRFTQESVIDESEDFTVGTW